MANLTYGTPEFYQEQFSDFLADVDADTPGSVDAILRGFGLAVDDWLNYHQAQANAYAQLRQRVRETFAV